MEPRKKLTPEEQKKANKGCLTILVIVIAVFIFYKIGSNDKTDKATTTYETTLNATSTKDLPKEVAPDVLIKRIGEEYTSIVTQMKSPNSYSSIDQLVNQLTNFNQWNNYVNDGKSSSEDSVKKAAAKLEKLLVDFQRKEFPNLRKSYCSISKDKLWEENVDVKHLGSPYTTIELSGGFFASNKNIKTTQETIQEIVKRLRFKKVNYRWYKGADEYTYYTLETPNDSKLGDYY